MSTLAHVVQSLTEFGTETEDDYEVGYAEGDDGEPPLDALAIVLVAIRDCRAELATFADRVEGDLVARMDLVAVKDLNVEGVGLVEKKHATKRTQWDHEALIPAVVARLADEPGVFHDEDGTLFPYQTIGHNLARRLRESVSFGAGKVTGLRPLGIDPDEFCHTEHGKAQIKLPARVL